MSAYLALLLGIIQGVTEFLPVSSSGHLKLIQTIFGLNNLDQYISFDLACHLGTLGAVIAILWRDLLDLFSKERSQMTLIVLGTLPLFLIPLVRGPINWVYAHPGALGCCFFLTALILYAGERWGRPVERKRRKVEGLLVGAFQAIAVFPGISRSGSTISGARLLGWEPEKAARFSFLLAIPAILGGVVLQLFTREPADIGFSIYAIGFLASFVTGLLGLTCLLKIIRAKRLMPFVWYCVIIGIISLVVI